MLFMLLPGCREACCFDKWPAFALHQQAACACSTNSCAACLTPLHQYQPPACHQQYSDEDTTFRLVQLLFRLVSCAATASATNMPPKRTLEGDPLSGLHQPMLYLIGFAAAASATFTLSAAEFRSGTSLSGLYQLLLCLTDFVASATVTCTPSAVFGAPLLAMPNIVLQVVRWRVQLRWNSLCSTSGYAMGDSAQMQLPVQHIRLCSGEVSSDESHSSFWSCS